MEQERLNRLEEQLQAQLEVSSDEFCDALRTNASVLILGQNYQTVCYGREYFLEAASRAFLGPNEAAAQNYTELWKKIAGRVDMPDGTAQFRPLSEQVCGSWERLIDEAREALQRNSQEAMKRTCRMLCAGWRMVATSAPETLVRTLPGSPFSPRKTVLHTDELLPQTFRASSLSLLQLFAPGHDLRLNFDEPDFVWETGSRARKVLCEAVGRAIPYSGYLVLDGWNPENDWFSAQDLLYIMDELQNSEGRDQIRVVCFDKDASAFKNVDRTLRRLVNRIVFLDGHLTDLFMEEQEPESASMLFDEYYHLHLLSVKARERPLDIAVPVQQWQKLPFTGDACLLPLEHLSDESFMPIDREAQMTTFLAGNREIPLWWDYENCYFERDQYQELYKKVFTSLKTGSQRTDFLLLKGPACSGKTVMLGRLALDMSVHFPTIYLGPSAMPKEKEGPEDIYSQLAVFVREQFTKVMQDRKFNRKRVLVIWDGGYYETEAREIYYQLRSQLQMSTEFLLVGSAYAKPRSDRAPREDEVTLRAQLSEAEQNSLFERLNQNLGMERSQFERALQMGAQRRGWQPQRASEENTLLSVLSHLFRGVNETIFLNLRQSAMNESKAARAALKTALNRNMEELEEARRDGAITTALNAFECNWGEDDSIRQRITNCAVLLDDILAVAGRWRQSLHFELVFRVMESLYKDRFGQPLGLLGQWQGLLNALLDYSPMIAWTGDDASSWTLQYRSALEAQLFLDSKYPHKITSDEEAERMKQAAPSDRVLGMEKRQVWQYCGKDGELLQEQVAVQVLCGVLKEGRLEGASNDFAYEALHLADCFGPNSEGEPGMTRWYPFIAQALITRGRKNIAALQKAAFLLRHFDWNDECQNAYNEGRPQPKKAYDNQLETGKILETAIQMVKNAPTSVSARQQIQLYTEWCSNRRFLYCPHAEFTRQLPEEERKLAAEREDYGEELLLEVEKTIREKLIPLSSAAEERDNQHIVYIYNDMLVADIRVYKRLRPQDLHRLAGHMDFYWQHILFGLMDMKELAGAGQSQRNKINEILSGWRELSKGTQWETFAARKQDEHDQELYSCDPGAWWTNRITELWHGSMPDQAAQEDADWLKENLYLRSLDFHWDGRKLSDAERERAKWIVEVMEGKKAAADRQEIRLPNGALAHGCRDICTAYLDEHFRLQEYYVRAKFMAETGYFPYVDMAPVFLMEPWWNDVRAVCDNYCEDATGQAKDLLPYFLRAVLQWFNTPDASLIRRQRQPEMFDPCRGALRAPRNGRYNTSYLLLCWSDKTPVQVTCNVELEKKCGKITEVHKPGSTAVTDDEFDQMKKQLKGKYLYVADTVLGAGQNGGNNYVFRVRFNREGPVAAPLTDFASVSPEKGGQR